MSDRLHYLFMFVSLTVLLVVQHCPIVCPVIRQKSVSLTGRSVNCSVIHWHLMQGIMQSCTEQCLWWCSCCNMKSLVDWFSLFAYMLNCWSRTVWSAWNGLLLFVVLHCFYYIEFPSCNSRVSIETRFRPSVYLLLVWTELDCQWRREGEGGDRWPAPDTVTGRCRDPIDRLIDITGGGAPQNVAKRPGEGATGEVRPGKRNGRSVSGRREGNRCAPPPRVDVAGQSVNVVGGWARTSADSSWVSGTVAHLSNHRRGARWGDTIADWPPDAGYGRPQACCRTRPDDQPTSQWSFLFPIEADWNGC